MSELKCKVEKNAIPMSRLIGKGKLDQLKNRFNGSSVKTTQRSLSRLDKMASNKQKESQARLEAQKAERKAKKEAEKEK